MIDDEPTTQRAAAARQAAAAAPINDQRTRLRPISHAMVAALVALTVGSILDARALHKSAVTQPASVTREIAMAATGALQAITDFTQVSQIRQSIASAIGMGDKDTIDTNLNLPVKAATPTPAAPAKLVYSAQQKMAIYTGGDSLMETVSLAMQQIAPRTGVATVEPDDSHISTGLNRPDAFNWFNNLRRVLKRKDPDVVALMFGGNDADAFMSGMPAGAPPIQSFGDAAWESEYRRRVGGMMELATQKPGRFVVWMGEPQMADIGLNAKQLKLNEIYKSEAEKRPGRVAYIDTYELFSPGGAAYSDTITVDGKPKLVREPDGIHITMEGGAMITGVMLKLLSNQFDLQGALPASLSLTQ